MTIETRKFGQRSFGRRKTRGTEDEALPSADVAENADLENLPHRPQKSARNRVMDLLSRRNYSERELRERIEPYYPIEQVNEAVEFARESKWLLPDAELAERVATSLGRKRKGHRFINQFLKSKGLPTVAKDSDDEIAKGCALIEAKMAHKLPAGHRLDFAEQQKISRILANRGFDSETIRAVIDAVKKNLGATP